MSIGRYGLVLFCGIGFVWFKNNEVYNYKVFV